MKKIVLLILCGFLLTGCKAVYHVEINEDINETLDVYVDSEEKNKIVDEDLNITYIDYFNNLNSKKLNVNYENIKPEDFIDSDDKFYNVNKIDDANRYGTRFSYKFDEEEFSKSSIINKYFKNFRFLKNDGIYTYKSNGIISAFNEYKYLDEIKIIVDLNKDFNLILSNSDFISNNQMIWVFNRDNYKEKDILFYFSKTKKNNTVIDNDKKPNEDKKDDNKQNESNNNYLFILLGLLLCIAVILVVFKLQSRKK